MEEAPLRGKVPCLEGRFEGAGPQGRYGFMPGWHGLYSISPNAKILERKEVCKPGGISVQGEAGCRQHLQSYCRYPLERRRAIVDDAGIFKVLGRWRKPQARNQNIENGTYQKTGNAVNMLGGHSL